MFFLHDTIILLKAFNLNLFVITFKLYKSNLKKRTDTKVTPLTNRTRRLAQTPSSLVARSANHATSRPISCRVRHIHMQLVHACMYKRIYIYIYNYMALCVYTHVFYSHISMALDFLFIPSFWATVWFLYSIKIVINFFITFLKIFLL